MLMLNDFSYELPYVRIRAGHAFLRQLSTSYSHSPSSSGTKGAMGNASVGFQETQSRSYPLARNYQLDWTLFIRTMTDPVIRASF